MKGKNPDVVYMIMGCYYEKDKMCEWIQEISLSKRKCEAIRKQLNEKLKEDIERGGEIAHKYLKSRKDVEWNKRQFAMGYMDEDEYIFFHLYYYKKQLPFKIQTVKLT
jgi:hypothetical protein